MTRPTRDAPDDHRVLILAPAGRDASIARDLLARHGVAAVGCRTIDALGAEWERGAAALLLAEEALVPPALRALGARVAAQPPWSDIPILLFLSGVATGASVERFGALRNVSVLERPVRIPALVSSVKAALRARLRQYEVRELMAELRAANRAKDDFLAMVSHELRTPLNVIRGTARRLVETYEGPQPVSHAIERIDRNAGVLTRLVDDLLDVSRLQRGGLRLTIEPVDLVQIVATAIDTARLGADTKGVRIVTDFAPPSAPVTGDALRLQQVASNLLSNAIKFTPPGGTVTVSLHVTDSRVALTVVDTGEGISPDFLPHVFEPFRQSDAGSRHGGLGLGLAIVRQLVELHGGSISARSGGTHGGAAFEVRLPLRSAAALPA
jgi:signal transduction histidine kinase